MVKAPVSVPLMLSFPLTAGEAVDVYNHAKVLASLTTCVLPATELIFFETALAVSSASTSITLVSEPAAIVMSWLAAAALVGSTPEFPATAAVFLPAITYAPS